MCSSSVSFTWASIYWLTSPMGLSIPSFGSNKVPARPRAVVSRSVWSLALSRFFYNRLALFGVCLLAFLVLISVFANVLAPYNPIRRNVSEAMMGPSLRHWLGTDPLGRDEF